MRRERSQDLKVTQDHRRQWQDCIYVYPVVSRRSRGVSIGINLSLDKQCNFDCVYCQVNRSISRTGQPIDLGILAGELRRALQAVISGGLWAEQRFAATPLQLRRVNDIALSGDGEPTCCPAFGDVVRLAADARRENSAGDVKIVVITNATRLSDAGVRDALPVLTDNNGEIWAKLDAGTEEMFQRINRPREAITLPDICRNIAAAARIMPVVIQTLLFRLDDQPPSPTEIDAYCDRLRELLAAGGRIRQVQLHTIARAPAQACVKRLADDELNAIAEIVRQALPAVDVTVTYGADIPPQ